MKNTEDLSELDCLITPLSPISSSSSKSSYGSVKLPPDEEQHLTGTRTSPPWDVGSTNSINHDHVEEEVEETGAGAGVGPFTSNRIQDEILQTSDQCTQTMTICHRIKMELSKNYHLFSLQEDYDSTMIHVQKSFAPIHYLGIPFVIRLYWWTVTYNCIIEDHHYALSHRSNNMMYFSHLTNFTLICTLVYQTLSCFLCFIAILRRKHYFVLYQPQAQGQQGQGQEYDNGNTRPGILVCITWFLYSIVLTGEFIVAIGYWVYEADPNHPIINFINLYKHGIIGVLLWFDGNVLGRIPLRLKHLGGLLVYGTVYLLWSMYFAYHRLGTHGGVIYRFIDWRRDPKGAASLSFTFVFVIGPLLYFLFWFLSVCGGRCCCCCCCCQCCCSYGDSNRRVVKNETVRWSSRRNTSNWWHCCGHELVKSRSHSLELGGDSMEYNL